MNAVVVVVVVVVDGVVIVFVLWIFGRTVASRIACNKALLMLAWSANISSGLVGATGGSEAGLPPPNSMCALVLQCLGVACYFYVTNNIWL